MTDLIESLVRGLGLGGLYAVLGVSFVIVYRATGVINFATPALMILGAFFTGSFGNAIGLPAQPAEDGRDADGAGDRTSRRSTAVLSLAPPTARPGGCAPCSGTSYTSRSDAAACRAAAPLADEPAPSCNSP